MAKINVIKVGGNVIENPNALDNFLKDFAALAGPKILVHGGGKKQVNGQNDWIFRLK